MLFRSLYVGINGSGVVPTVPGDGAKVLVDQELEFEEHGGGARLARRGIEREGGATEGVKRRQGWSARS